MTPALTFLVGLAVLVLFGWYFATDQGPRKRLLAMTLMLVLVVSSIVTIWPPQKKIALGLDIQGGTSFLIRLKGGDKEVTKGMLDQAVEVIRKRVDVFGVSEPIISPVANDRILVQIPGLDTAKIQEARDQLSRVAKLEFRLVYPDNGERLRAIDAGKEVIPPEYRIESYKQQHQAEGEKPIEERLLIKKKADLAGDRVSSMRALPTNETGGWFICGFDSEGAKQFGNITAANVHHRFAIVLDGVIQSAPVIQDAIYGGDAQITGRFTEEEARGLASVLENPLQTPVSIEEERSVSPTLGLDSIRASILAGLVGLAITLVCVAIYYKIPGLVANLALIINLILLVGALTMFHFVLTLPGIAGIILTIGLSVDANVLIYERLREEMALGKSLKVALNTAYDKAFSSIFDANVTTLITAAILFWKASGPVRGFAICTYAWHFGIFVHGSHRGAELSRLACRYGPGEAHLDVAFDFSTKHQFSRQRFHRVHVLPRAAPGWSICLLQTRRAQFRRRFSRRRPDHVKRAGHDRYWAGARRAKANRICRCFNSGIVRKSAGVT